MPLPAGHQQVEQDRAPDVLPHYGELTGSSAGEPPSGSESIGHRATKTGLTIRSKLDEGSYPTGRKLSDDQMKGLSLRRDKFLGEWNYTILPRCS